MVFDSIFMFMAVTMIEIIFKGRFSKIDFGFLRNLIFASKEVRFNDPAMYSFENIDDVITVFDTNSYFDFVITTDMLNIDGRTVPKVFINIGRDSQDIDLLFFFDLKDMQGDSLIGDLEHLKKWVSDFSNQYCFDFFTCRIDIGAKEDYFFDSNGYGRLYDQII